MSYSDNGYSLADIAAATGNSNNNGGAFGDGYGAWWIVLFLIFGWGRNGFGNNGYGGGSNGGVGENYVLATDFATIERKLDTIQSGICDATFALNNTVTNGFAGVQSTLCQGFAGVNQNLVSQGYETRIGIQGVQAQIADCCCQTKEGIAGINYNMAMNANNIQNAMCLNTRDILESQSSNTRAILDAITANKIENKNAQIQAQQNEINSLRLAASQQAQNAYLIDQLGTKCPVPSYVVQPPQPVTFPTNCCGQYNGCGC